MAIVKDLMGAGLPDQAAQRLGYTVGSLTSAGTTNADAAQMLKDATVVQVTGAASSGVKVPSDAELMQPYIVVNCDGNAKLMYPGTGNDFQGDTATTGTVPLNALGTTLVWRVTATRWGALVGAAG